MTKTNKAKEMLALSFMEIASVESGLYQNVLEKIKQEALRGSRSYILELDHQPWTIKGEIVRLLKRDGFNVSTPGRILRNYTVSW
jgi:GH43 family beta-xylosidase